MTSSQNFTLDGTAGGGTMTVGGDLDMETPGDAEQVKALNLTFQNMAFSPSNPGIQLDGPENANITFNRDTFVTGNSACPAGYSGEFYVYNAGGSTTQTGLTVENSVFVAPTDLWNPDRAVQDGAPMAFKNNVMVGYLDHGGASCNHIDGLQLYSGSNGTVGSDTFTGNLCYDDYGCIMGFDGTAQNTITDNVCFDMQRDCIALFSDSPGSVVDHNVELAGGADPGYCNSMNAPSSPIVGACNIGYLMDTGAKSGDRSNSGQVYTNNVSQSAPSLGGGALATDTNNMWPGASSPNINGSATFVGGAHPTTWAGFELAAGSTGHAAGSDGQDIGIRASAGGPPTGGGSAPVNTAAPSLTGSPTSGSTLTTTNGTWTITGNIPTATTYQWFDCPSSTFSITGCTAIQPHTSPQSANNSTYTLTSSDVNNYVFAMVTMTNATGQINAISNPIGPIG